MTKAALFNFAYHPRHDWLERIRDCIKEEPWGNDLKVLEIFLRANFEIAQGQGKVKITKDRTAACWKPGYLVSPSSEPVVLTYQKNPKSGLQEWVFDKVVLGNKLVLDNEEINVSDLQIKYDPPEFHADWDVYIDQKNFEHIMQHNLERLKNVFGEELIKNIHFLFRAIYGEIALEKKEEVNIIPEWYNGQFQFLMPLYLKSTDKVDLTATLTIDETMKRYQVSTLLPPAYAYAYARSVVKSKAMFGAWISLSEEDLNKVNEIIAEDDEG